MNLVLLALLASGAPAFAADGESPVPNDFAYAIPLTIPSGASVCKLQVPADVYKSVVRDDLSDLRVFNGQGEVMPHGLEHQTADERKKYSHLPLSIFPIAGTPASDDSAVEVSKGPDGRVMSVKFSGQDSPKSVARFPVAYLIELTNPPGGLRSLQLGWSMEGPGRVVKLSVEASDDLVSWQELVHGASIARLTYRDQTLLQDSLELNGVRTRYLKLTPEPGSPLRITDAAGEFLDLSSVDWPRERAPLKRTPIPAPSPGAPEPPEALFDTEGKYPVARLQAVIPEANTLLKLTLASGPTPFGPWNPRWSGLVYRVLVDGKEVSSSAIPLPTEVSDRYWAVLGPRGQLGRFGLEIEWVSHTLTFLARGTGPFKLAFGSASTPFHDFGFAALVQSLQAARNGQPIEPAAATPGTREELGGVSRLTQAEGAAPPRWRQWALWAILGLAISVVGSMAWKLYRELGSKTE